MSAPVFENQNTTKSVDAQDDDGSDGSSTLPGSTKQALLLDYSRRSVFIKNKWNKSYMIKSIKFTGRDKNDYISEHVFKDLVREGVDSEEA